MKSFVKAFIHKLVRITTPVRDFRNVRFSAWCLLETSGFRQVRSSKAVQLRVYRAKSKLITLSSMLTTIFFVECRFSGKCLRCNLHKLPPPGNVAPNLSFQLNKHRITRCDSTSVSHTGVVFNGVITRIYITDISGSDTNNINKLLVSISSTRSRNCCHTDPQSELTTQFSIEIYQSFFHSLDNVNWHRHRKYQYNKRNNYQSTTWWEDIRLNDKVNKTVNYLIYLVCKIKSLPTRTQIHHFQQHLFTELMKRSRFKALVGLK